MKLFIHILLVGHLLMACNRKSDTKLQEFKTENVELTEEIDDVTPPPLGLPSKFKTLQEWLFNISDIEKPKRSIASYNFGLFESPEEYTIFVVGINKYGTAQHAITRIEFEPASMYYQLPKSEYQHLKRE